MRRIFFLFLLLPAVFSARAQEERFDIMQHDIAVRDPFITVDREAGRYYLVTAARDGQHMALQTYESPDLIHWRRLGLNYRGNPARPRGASTSARCFRGAGSRRTTITTCCTRGSPSA